MTKIFITFGSEQQNFRDATHRLTTQAKNIELFDEIINYSVEDLKKDDEFWKKHEEFILNNPRGYGYWLWKPYLIKKTMEKMNNGDILVYADCGCEIASYKKHEINNLFEIVKNDYIIGSFICIEKEYNKMDLLLKFDMLKDEYLNTPQRQASALIILVCEKTRKFVEEWYNIGCDYHLIDDTPSIHKNLDCFKEHRHDQSIFSLLSKKYNIYSSISLIWIIDIKRNKTGIATV